MDILISCQSGDYTSDIYPRLRADGWEGYWIDAASPLRMQPDAVIILDPVNRRVIDTALARGVKTYVGGNCTVSLMLMALHGLLEAGLVEWLTGMTLPGRLRRRCAADARARSADGRGTRCGGTLAGRSGVVHSRH
jgi:aspartate-semialdehyde dehydrogenase